MNSISKLIAAGAFALAVSAPVAAQDTNNAVHSLKQLLETDTYTGILGAMVNPETLNNPIAVCAECHSGEDVVRYTKTLGPMLQMINPVNWINPMAYANMAAPMVDPETYTAWYNAWMKRYGGLVGYGDDPAAAQSPAPEEGTGTAPTDE